MKYIPQKPAEGILQLSDFTDTKSYKIPCSCGCDKDVTVVIDIDDFGISTNFYATTKTKYWYNRWNINYSENWILFNCKLLFNDWYNRIDIIWKALTKGYVETQSDVILSPQQAINFAETLKTAVMEFEVLEETRKTANAVIKSKQSEINDSV